MARYPVLSRLSYDGELYDPNDPTTPQTIDIDADAADALAPLGVIGPALEEASAPQAEPTTVTAEVITSDPVPAEATTVDQAATKKAAKGG